MKIRIFVSLLLLVSLWYSISPAKYVRLSSAHQNSSAAADAQIMLGKMTPGERVGQLFLVAFTGSTMNEQSQIYDLITRYHVGGVVLLAGNDNFSAAPDTVKSVYQLIGQLQGAEKRLRKFSLPRRIPVRLRHCQVPQLFQQITFLCSSVFHRMAMAIQMTRS